MPEPTANPPPHPPPISAMSSPPNFVPLPNQTSPDAAVRGTATFTAVVERDLDSGTLIGHVPGFPGAHTHAADEERLRANLVEVIGMLLEGGAPGLDSEACGLMSVEVPVPPYRPISLPPEPRGDTAGAAVGEAVAA